MPGVRTASRWLDAFRVPRSCRLGTKRSMVLARHELEARWALVLLPCHRAAPAAAAHGRQFTGAAPACNVCTWWKLA
jgi:hypothetical protein